MGHVANFPIVKGKLVQNVIALLNRWKQTSSLLTSTCWLVAGDQELWCVWLQVYHRGRGRGSKCHLRQQHVGALEC